MVFRVGINCPVFVQILKVICVYVCVCRCVYNMRHLFFISDCSYLCCVPTLQTSAMLQQKVDGLESDLQAMKSAEQLHKEEETSWGKVKETLESDLEATETMLDTTKIQLEKEQKLRYLLSYNDLCARLHTRTHTHTHTHTHTTHTHTHVHTLDSSKAPFSIILASA